MVNLLFFDIQKTLFRFLMFNLFALTIFTEGCSSGPPADTNQSSKRHSLPLYQVKSEKIPDIYMTAGSVISDSSVNISSRIAGFIKDITVFEGEKVSKGRLLVVIDNADVEGAIHQARAGVAKAESAFKDAQTDAQRFESLFKRGSASDNAMRKARLRRDVAGDSLKEARAAHKTAVAQRDYINIISPVDGVVIARQKRKGDLATPGAAIITVESAHALLFETYVAESRVGSIVSGARVDVTIDALKDSIKGIVARIVPSGDPLTRRYQVKISLPDIPGLLPGMFGRVSFVVGNEDLLIIPRSSMFIRGGLKGVFVPDKNNKVRFRWLRIGGELPEGLEVKAGLLSGDTIVAIAQPDLRDGDVITNMIAANE